jgi:aryl-alcohol dehydrogenase-like predicted oxidoreductase
VERNRLGDTGLTVSRLGLGLAALGRPGYINLGHDRDLERDRTVAGLERQACTVLDTARAAGVTYLDAARSYGRAEQFLAGWLATRSVPPEAVVVGSKWGYSYTADWAVDAEVHEVKEHSRSTLDRQIDESLALLGGHLRVYQIHSATDESGVLDNQAVLSRLGELRDEGLVIGLTTSGPRQAATIRRALAIEQGGCRLFGTVQATWNLLETSAGTALAAANEAGLGVIVKEAVANGRLTRRDPKLAAELEGQVSGAAADAIALAAALQQPWADVVLSGAATTDQFAENLTALDLPTGMIAGLRNITEEPEDYWRTRSQLPWI